MTSMEQVFLKVFTERLAGRGFAPAATESPYLCSIVDSELVQVLTFLTFEGDAPNLCRLHLVGGVFTVFREQMPLFRSPQENAAWLVGADLLYARKYGWQTNLDFAYDLRQIPYCCNDARTIRWAAWEAVDIAEKFMLPQLLNVTNLTDCLDFYRTMGLPIAINDERQRAVSEGWLSILCLCDDTPDLRKMKQRLAFLARRDALTDSESDEMLTEQLRTECELFSKRADIFADAEILRATKQMLIWRKRANLAALRECGIG